VVLEQGEEIQLVHTNDGRLAAPGDAALVVVALVAAFSVGAWTGALILILTHPGHGIGVGMAAVAATLTLVALNLGLDVARRRRLREALTDIRAEIHAVAGPAHAETVEGLAALAREVEQITAKVENVYWSGYAAGATDVRGGDGGTVARLPHRAQ
jgi:uncharacterized membrane protein